MDLATITIEGAGGVELRYVREFLSGTERLYDRFCALEEMTSGNSGGLLLQHGGAPIIDDAVFKEFPEVRLSLRSVELHSPGFWEFFGKANPLEFIRQLLNDLHERNKDYSYRNDAEKENLYLQNMLLKNQVVREQVDLLKRAGVSDKKVQALLVEQFGPAVQAIRHAQEQNVCSVAVVEVQKNDNDNAAPSSHNF